MPCHVSNVPACSAVVVPVTLSSFLGVILWHNIYRGSLASQYVYDRNGFILKLQKLKLEFFSFFKKSKILDKKCFCSIFLGFIELDWIYRNIPKPNIDSVWYSIPIGCILEKLKQDIRMEESIRNHTYSCSCILYWALKSPRFIF